MTSLQKDRAARLITFVVAGAGLFCVVVLLILVSLILGGLLIDVLQRSFDFSEWAAKGVITFLVLACFVVVGWAVCLVPDPDNHDPEDPNP